MFGMFGEEEQPTNIRLGYGAGSTDYMGELLGAEQSTGKERTDYGFYAHSRFGHMKGEIGDTGHDGQMSNEQGKAAAQSIQQKIDMYALLDETIIKGLGLDQHRIDEIASQLTQDIENSMRHGVGIDEIIANRYRDLFNTIGGEADQVYDSLNGSIEENIIATVSYISETERVKDLLNIIGGEASQVYDRLNGSIEENLIVTVSYISATDKVKALYNDLINTQDGNSRSITDLASGLLGVNNIFEQINLNSMKLDTIGAEAAKALLSVAGGMDQFTKKSNYYYGNFFSEEEKRAKVEAFARNALDEFNAKYSEYGILTLENTNSLRELIEGLDSADPAFNAILNSALELAPIIISGSDAINQLAIETDNLTEAEEKALALKAEQIEQQRIENENLKKGTLSQIGSNNPRFAMDELMRIWDPRVQEANRWLSGKGQGDLQFGNFQQQGISGYKSNINNIRQRAYGYLKSDVSGDRGDAQTAINWINEFEQALDQYKSYQDALTNNIDIVNDNNDTLTNFGMSLIDAKRALQEYSDSLLLSNFSPLTGEQRFREAQGQYGVELLKAQAGNIESISSLPQFIDRYLTEAQKMYASSEQYTDIFHNVRGAIGGITGLEPLATGSDFIPNDGAFFLHQGEAVHTAADNKQLHSEIRSLKEEVANQTNIIAGLLVENNTNTSQIKDANERIADSSEEQADTRRIA